MLNQPHSWQAAVSTRREEKHNKDNRYGHNKPHSPDTASYRWCNRQLNKKGDIIVVPATVAAASIKTTSFFLFFDRSMSLWWMDGAGGVCDVVAFGMWDMRARCVPFLKQWFPLREKSLKRLSHCKEYLETQASHSWWLDLFFCRQAFFWCWQNMAEHTAHARGQPAGKR